MPYLEFNGVSKIYKLGDVTVEAVKNASFSIDEGELVVIVGPSGAGKTTILNLVGGMDVVSDGKIILDGKVISEYGKKELTKYRREDIGFVFQFYNLIQNLTALENVELASAITKHSLDPKNVLIEVGLEHRINSFPTQLSGGEQQRVSIARAVAKNPKLLLCDEPTGALDYKTGKSILKLLQDMAQKRNTTVVIITHNTIFEQIANKVIRVSDGTIVEVSINNAPLLVDEVSW